MNSDAAHRQIRSALRAELKMRHGQIGQIEADLSRSEGYLSRFCRGDMEITLKGCLDTLEALEVEPGSFFSSALSTITTSEDLVRRLAGKGTPDRTLGIVEDVIREVINSTDGMTQPRRFHQANTDELKNETIEIQLRRLRTAKKYRSPAFVRDYWMCLERLRFDDPRGTLRLALGAIQYVLPQMELARRKKIEYLSRYLATYASCARSLDDLHTAYSTIALGLDLVGAGELPLLRADFLRQAGAFCVTTADYTSGLTLLREAQELAFDAEDQRGLGLVVATKGRLLFYSGQEFEATRNYERGLALLAPFDDEEVRRYRAAALSGLVDVYTHQNDFEKAKFWLARAASILGDGGGLLIAKLAWQEGTIERSLGEYSKAVLCFERALKLLESGTVIDSALVSVELASTLLEAGRHREAIGIAKGMAALTDAMRDNKLAQGALLEFLRIVLAGRLDLALLGHFKMSLETGRPLKGAPKG